MQYVPNFTELDKLVESGHLLKKESNNLVLYNYSDLTTYDKLWNEHTINSRGTIYNKLTGEVIARGLPKIFNLGELSKEKQDSIMRLRKFEVFTKEDGSMGLVAFYNNKWNVTTRGSFNSEQALKAIEMLSKYNLKQLNKNFSYVVEIIYPENRIIINYGSKEELVLLACIETKTGREADLEALKGHVPFPIVESHSFNRIDQVIEAVEKMDSNNEGFVVKLRTGERFKVKSAEYLRIAKIMTNTSPLMLWESMKDGKVDQKLMESIPEEFREEYESIKEQLEISYLEVLVEATKRFNDVVDIIKSLDAKEIGLYLKDNNDELNAFVFPILKQKRDAIEKMIMREIKPVGNIL